MARIVDIISRADGKFDRRLIRFFQNAVGFEQNRNVSELKSAFQAIQKNVITTEKDQEFLQADFRKRKFLPVHELGELHSFTDVFLVGPHPCVSARFLKHEAYAQFNCLPIKFFLFKQFEFRFYEAALQVLIENYELGNTEPVIVPSLPKIPMVGPDPDFETEHPDPLPEAVFQAISPEVSFNLVPYFRMWGGNRPFRSVSFQQHGFEAANSFRNLLEVDYLSHPLWADVPLEDFAKMLNEIPKQHHNFGFILKKVPIPNSSRNSFREILLVLGTQEGEKFIVQTGKKKVSCTHLCFPSYPQCFAVNMDQKVILSPNPICSWIIGFDSILEDPSGAGFHFSIVTGIDISCVFCNKMRVYKLATKTPEVN